LCAKHIRLIDAFIMRLYEALAALPHLQHSTICEKLFATKRQDLRLCSSRRRTIHWRRACT
jgi:hypothetical protein